MKRNAVVIEKGPTNYGAYVLGLPGCVAVADTVQKVEQLIREVIPFHIERLRLNGDPVPEPTSLVEFVDAEVAA